MSCQFAPGYTPHPVHRNRAEAVNLLEVPPLSPFLSWCLLEK
ncbi:unnamed protein product [Staurois parvus]|uniref:Uncharacterized protein n=1 Tax=Staurois parvus TaxID=386267 RepID=A0ABN9GGW3_9NEOB|nr:unnamed protein product [Staurois parvus]